LLKKQDVSSTPSRAKTVLIRVKKISLTSACPELAEWVAIRSIKKTKIMQNKPNFQNAKNVLTLIDTRNYNKL